MKPRIHYRLLLVGLLPGILLPACSMPSLVEISRRRTATQNEMYSKVHNAKSNIAVPYTITDWDVLNYTDEVKRKLQNQTNTHMGIRYGSATTQTTLGALAGATTTFGWSAATASTLGMGATYIFGLGQIFNAKDKAQAYETAYTAIEKAESAYYLNQLGYTIVTGSGGSPRPVQTGSNNGAAIPNQHALTFDGETLYYRVTKTLKVLDDALAQKIPNLQDLKDSQGDSSAPPAPPLIPADKTPKKTPPAPSAPRLEESAAPSPQSAAAMPPSRMMRG